MASFQSICRAIATLLVLVASATITWAQIPPNADYGDAPEDGSARYAAPFDSVIATFPTSFGTTHSRFGLPGAHCLDVLDSWLGETVGAEVGPSDSNDPDGIENFDDDDSFDDGFLGGYCGDIPDDLTATDQEVSLEFTVTVAATAPEQTRYLNVLIDLDRDGRWENEWVVQDFPVEVLPGSTSLIATPVFIVPFPVPEAWARVTLTASPVGDAFVDDGSGWDGSGAFSAGEVEDYLLSRQSAARAQLRSFYFALGLATDFAAEADTASQTAYDVAQSLASLAATVDVSAVAVAMASIQASVDAIAQVQSEVDVISSSALALCAEIEASASESSAICAACPCATFCAAMATSVSASLSACISIENSVQAAVGAVASASTFMQVQADVAAEAEVDVNVSVTAIAEAAAAALADADAVAFAASQASAAASAIAVAIAEAQTAACGGDLTALLSTVAGARALAVAAADAYAVAEARAIAVAQAETAASVEFAVATAAVTRTCAVAEVATQTETQTSQFASMAAMVQAMAEVTASAGGASTVAIAVTCSQECCPPPTTGSSVPGDTNCDGGFDISDPIFALAALFTPGSPQPLSCP